MSASRLVSILGSLVGRGGDEGPGDLNYNEPVLRVWTEDASDAPPGYEPHRCPGGLHYYDVPVADLDTGCEPDAFLYAEAVNRAREPRTAHPHGLAAPKAWIPYRGPQGGRGWKNTDTGAVEYTGDPPGQVIDVDQIEDEELRDEIAAALAERGLIADESADGVEDIRGRTVAGADLSGNRVVGEADGVEKVEGGDTLVRVEDDDDFVHHIPLDEARIEDVDQKAWMPYTGPQGGEGWRNTDTGEISYDDEPPGETITAEELREELERHGLAEEQIQEAVDRLEEAVDDGGGEAREVARQIAGPAAGDEETEEIAQALRWLPPDADNDDMADVLVSLGYSPDQADRMTAAHIDVESVAGAEVPPPDTDGGLIKAPPGTTYDDLRSAIKSAGAEVATFGTGNVMDDTIINMRQEEVSMLAAAEVVALKRKDSGRWDQEEVDQFIDTLRDELAERTASSEGSPSDFEDEVGFSVPDETTIQDIWDALGGVNEKSTVLSMVPEDARDDPRQVMKATQRALNNSLTTSDRSFSQRLSATVENPFENETEQPYDVPPEGNPANYDDASPISNKIGSTGISANSMYVAEDDEYGRLFVTNTSQQRVDLYGGNAEYARDADRAMSGYRGMQAAGFPVPDHHREEGEFWSVEEADGKPIKEADGSDLEDVSEDEMLDFTLSSALVGNWDIHGDNVFVTEDGELSPIDLDLSGHHLHQDAAQSNRNPIDQSSFTNRLYELTEDMGWSSEEQEQFSEMMQERTQEWAEQNADEIRSAALEGDPDPDIEAAIDENLFKMKNGEFWT